MLRTALTEHGVHWNPIEVRLHGERLSCGGDGMAAVERRTLLRLLHVAHHPRRFRPVANVNPHPDPDHPIARELGRQLDHGAAALKIHPVHGGFRADDAMMYPAYAVPVERGVPLVVHCGASTFPGSTNSYADPVLLDPVVRDLPELQVVLAHGVRGW